MCGLDLASHVIVFVYRFYLKGSIDFWNCASLSRRSLAILLGTFLTSQTCWTWNWASVKKKCDSIDFKREVGEWSYLKISSERQLCGENLRGMARLVQDIRKITLINQGLQKTSVNENDNLLLQDMTIPGPFSSHRLCLIIACSSSSVTIHYFIAWFLLFSLHSGVFLDS